jgi:hypothetical protein
VDSGVLLRTDSGDREFTMGPEKQIDACRCSGALIFAMPMTPLRDRTVA